MTAIHEKDLIKEQFSMTPYIYIYIYIYIIYMLSLQNEGCMVFSLTSFNKELLCAIELK